MLEEILRTGLTKYVPDVDAQAIINAGATAYRKAISSTDLLGVEYAYAKAATSPLYLASGAAVVGFFSALGMGWVDIRKKKTVVKGEV